jgi:nucleotide-binding universal stress UspA family protein
VQVGFVQNEFAYIAKSNTGSSSWWQRLLGNTARYAEPVGEASADLFEPQAGAEGGIKRILVPTDFTLSSMQALGQAVQIARRCQATITLLYVVDVNFHIPPTGPVDANKLRAELRQEGREKLAQMVLGLAGAGVEVQTLIRQGLPWEEILDTARQYDLVVIGKHKPQPFWHLFTRQTVKGVLEATPCPVMVVRERAANPKSEARNPKEIRNSNSEELHR